MRPLTSRRTAVARTLCLTITGFAASAVLTFSTTTHALASQNLPANTHGAELIQSLGCGSCHYVPGVPSANGNVGPPLAGVGTRVYIAGMLRNTRDNMVRWLMHPQSIVPGNVMPEMNINRTDAEAIEAYLRTLK